MPVTEVFAAMTVRDRDSAIGFYERLLGAPPTMLPNDDEAAWQLTGGGWLYVLRDPDRAGRSVVTLLVDDFDDRLASAAAAGIELGPVETVAGSVRTTWITDEEVSVLAPFAVRSSLESSPLLLPAGGGEVQSASACKALASQHDGRHRRGHDANRPPAQWHGRRRASGVHRLGGCRRLPG